MKRNQIHDLLNSAIDKKTPDCWDKINGASPLHTLDALDFEANTGKPKRKFFIAACSAAVIMLLVLLGSVILSNSPNNTYIAIDINPSIELETNKLDQIVSVNAVNADAQTLLGDSKLIGMNIENAVDQIIELTLAQGYLKAGRTNDILVTVSNSDKSQELMDKINTSIDALLQTKLIDVKVMNQSIDINDKLLDDAHNKGVSAGKLSVIQRIADEDDSITIDELARISVADLVHYAKTHHVKLENLIDNYEDSHEDVQETEEEHKSTARPNVVKDDDDDKDDDKDDDRTADKQANREDKKKVEAIHAVRDTDKKSMYNEVKNGNKEMNKHDESDDDDDDDDDKKGDLKRKDKDDKDDQQHKIRERDRDHHSENIDKDRDRDDEKDHHKNNDKDRDDDRERTQRDNSD